MITGPPVNKAYLYEAQQSRRAANLEGATNKDMKTEQDEYVIKASWEKQEGTIDDRAQTKL